MHRNPLRLAVLLAVTLTLNLAAAASPSLPEADRHYQEHSYARALEAYRSVLAVGPTHPERPRIELQVARCLVKLRRWTDALEALRDYLQKHTEDIWAARALHELGNLERRMPHWGTRKAGQVHPGVRLPEGEPVNTWEEDLSNARKHLEAAKGLYDGFLAAEPTPVERPVLLSETIQLNFDLAELLQTRPGPIIIREEEAPAPARYDPSWADRRKILFLYDEVERLDPSPDRNPSARARYLKALYLLGSRHRPRRFEGRELTREEERKLTAEEAARDRAQAEKLLRSVVADFPSAEVADEAQFRLGLLLEEESRFVEAVAEFERLIELFPESRWVSDARAHLQGITWPVLSLQVNGTHLPGQEPAVQLRTRNIKAVTFTLHRLDLPGLLRGPGSREGRVRWSRLAELAGLRDGRPNLQPYLGEQLARWTEETGDEGKHLPRQAQVEVPVSEVGAYLLRASAPGREVSALLLVSDLAVIQRTDRTRSLLFVVDALTGEPVSGAEVRWRLEEGRGRRTASRVLTGTTDEDGLAVITLPRGFNGRVQGFAAKGRRYAFTGPAWSHYRRAEAGYLIYAYTDRPVYRPGQTVHFKVILRRLEGGRYHNAPGTRLTVSVRDPRGGEPKRFDLVTSDRGTASGEFHLAEEPPLGLYRLGVRLPAGGRVLRTQWATFRVEEYKKPEFEVRVKPAPAHIKLGRRARVTVEASYYFGGPVPGARVAYRVERSPFRHFYRRREPFGWLYGARGSRPWAYGGRELVATGELTTGADGKVTIEFDTPPPTKESARSEEPKRRGRLLPIPPPRPTNDWLYTVTVDVTDRSRRTITAAGTVTATERGFYAYVEPRRGFYAPGDTVEVEVRTLTPADDPVKATGKVTVYRVTYTGPKNDRRTEEELLSAPLSTDAQGRAFYRWTPDEEGLFKVAFSAPDGWGATVEAAADLWVAGPNFRGTHFRFANIDILTDKRTYREGETAHIMLSSNFPDSHVLLSQVADDEILDYRVLRIEGKTRLVDLPITERHVPNFFLDAELVRQGRPFRARRELFVPPTKHFLTVTVTADKSEYRPGETAVFTVRTRDHQGRPVAAELSLSVFDKAILYIQPELTPDIRRFFFGRRRSEAVGLGNWLQVTFATHLWEAEKPKEFRTHPWPPQWRGVAFGHRRALEAGGELLGLTEGATLQAKGDAAETPAAAAPVKPEVRTDFRDSAYWSPVVETGPDGEAKVEVPLPDSLTTWAASARGVSGEAQVGEAQREVVVTKRLLVRLQAPRFFLERDEITLSAVVHNRLASAKRVQCRLQVSRPELTLLDNPTQEVEVPAGGERRVDWTVRVRKEGTAEVTLSALTDEESDAVKMTFPALVHGIEKATAQAGTITGDGTATLQFSIPEERKPASARLELVLSPSVVNALIEALPYLADYPYGCTEQTMSRFLPSVVVADTLKQLGLNLEDLARRPRGELARRLAEKAGVFSTEELTKRVRAGLKRLYNFQQPTGGWGWWKQGQASPYMTAYVVYGLLVAQRAGYEVDAGRLEAALRFLTEEYKDIDQVHLRAYVGYVLSLAGRLKPEQLESVYRRRDDLNDYSRALLALAYHRLGLRERARLLCRNLENFVIIDEKRGTAHWSRRPGAPWWYWYNDDVETTAWVLRALVTITPGNPLAPQAAKWLLANRTGNRWKSTKDTAHAVYALARYARSAGELNPDYTLTIDLDGRSRRRLRITRENMFSFDSHIVIGDEELGSGRRTLTISKRGPGTLYFSAYLRYFTLEEDIKGAGHGVTVTRTYYRLHPRVVIRERDGREFKELTYDREPLPYLAQVRSGDLLEVALAVDADNHYEYVVFEDPKPAGCEPLEVRSGRRWAEGLCSNMELRDEKVVFFADSLSQGRHLIRYKLWAQIPGRLHVLPTRTYAMYAPRVRAISDEMRLTISDAPETSRAGH